MKALYDDKMREMNEFGYMMQQFSRETFTKAQKEALQRKIQDASKPSADPRIQQAFETKQGVPALSCKQPSYR
jgi:hypothetical protein